MLSAFSAQTTYAAESPSNKALEGKPILKVEVTGNKRIEGDAIREKLISKPGQLLNLKTIREDIGALHQMGFFSEIEMHGERSGPGVDLVVHVKERPAIAEVVFDGNERVDTDDLKEVIKSKDWNILDINEARQDVKRIQKHYEEKGFFLAKVDYDIEKIDDSKIKLIFRINDYEKVRIKQITFLNNRVYSDDKLKTLLRSTQEGGLFSFLTGSGNFKESAFEQDLQILTLWYLDNGYVKFRYEPPVITVSEDKKWLFVSIYVEEGLQYSVRDIGFSGDLLFSKDELSDGLKLEGDDTFKITERNADIQKLSEMYQDLGYAFVNVVPQMNIDDESRTIDIDYKFEKGELVYFGEINVTGNAKTYDKVIRRELRVFEGELYHGSNLRKSKERVERLGFFAPGEIVFNTRPRKDAPDIVDLEITVKERSTGTVTLGAGYGSVQKFFLTTQVSEINLFGRGQQLSFQGQFAADRESKSINLGFTEPYTLGTRWSSGFDFFYVNYPIPEKYLMRKLGFNLRFGHPITDNVSAFITYKNESLKIVDDRRNESNQDDFTDVGVLSSVIWSLVRDMRNNRFETTLGSYQKLSVETAGLGGDKRFVKSVFNNRYYVPVVGDLVLRNNIQFGHIAAIGSSPIPPAERFYMGGPNDLRGFDMFSVGPSRLGTAGRLEPLGGSFQMLGMLEFEYPLIREAGLKLVTFYDAGNSFQRFPGTSDEAFTVKQDAGFGLRWFSPIGPLRFEWGYPIGDQRTDPEFHFFIGPPF